MNANQISPLLNSTLALTRVWQDTSKKITISKINSKVTDVLVCKCGNEPYPGIEFYYKSRYSEETTIGIIASVNKTHIFSTNGTPYHKKEVEVKPKNIVREEKLNELGI